MIKLEARIVKARQQFFLCCGRCGSEMGHAYPGRLSLLPPYRLRDGVWRMTSHGKAALRKGHKPANRRRLRMGPSGQVYEKPVTASTRGTELIDPWVDVSEFPTIVECPACGSCNRVDDPPA